MSNVLLTATNPADSSVVPVACNAKGELMLEEPILVEGPKGDKGDKGDPGADGDPFTGTFDGNVTFNGIQSFLDTNLTLTGFSYPDNTGGTSRAGWIQSSIVDIAAPSDHSDPDISGKWSSLKIRDSSFSTTALIFASGAAVFSGDVVVGSGGKKWMIVENNGVAHLVEETGTLRSDVAPSSANHPPLRDIPDELTMIEDQLQKVMEKLKMTPEPNWKVSRN